MSTELFKKALQAHQSGNLALASEYYQKFLKRNPREYNALQLLGTVYHARGDNETALRYLQSSLKVKAEQPQVMLNVATCQRQLKDYDAALKTLSHLVRKDASNFGAFKARMFVLVEMGDFQRAYQELDAQIHKFPGHYELYNLLGAVACECKHYSKAIKAYQKAVKIRPNSDVARHNLGLAYLQNGEPEKALKEYQLVLNSGKHSYQLMHNLGNAYFELGHFEQALTYFNNALKLNYKSIDTHRRVSDTLWEMGNSKQFVQTFESALKRIPDDPKYLFEYVRRLLRVQRITDAEARLEAQLQTLQSNPEFQYLYGKCRLLLGDRKHALEWLKKAGQADTLSGCDKLEVCRFLLKFDLDREAEALATSVLTMQPAHTSALAMWGVCLHRRRDRQENELNNYEQLVTEYQLLDPVHDGNFYRTLIETLTRLHRSYEEQPDKSSHNGTQTSGHLFRRKEACLGELQHRIQEKLSQYLIEKSAFNKWGSWPDSEQFEISKAWSVRLKEGGYHRPHHHSHGKISGLFYAALPRSGSREKNGSGMVSFGTPTFKDNDAFQTEKIIKPETGKLILFPSYLWHCTLPQTGEGQKITVSFDVNEVKFS